MDVDCVGDLNLAMLYQLVLVCQPVQQLWQSFWSPMLGLWFGTLSQEMEAAPWGWELAALCSQASITNALPACMSSLAWGR